MKTLWRRIQFDVASPQNAIALFKDSAIHVRDRLLSHASVWGYQEA
jgi:hypothetical protein